MVFSVLQDRALLAKYSNQDSSLQFITDSVMKCSVSFRPHITLVSKVPQQLHLWTYLAAKSRIASSYACTSGLSRIACDVSRYGVSTASLRRLFYPSHSPWQVLFSWDPCWLISSWYLNCVFAIKKISGNLLYAAWMQKFIYWVKKAS